MANTPLDGFEPLNRHAKRLRVLGYKSVEGFLAAAQAAGGEISAYLGEDVENIISALPQEWQEHAAKISRPNGYHTGVRLEMIPRHLDAYELPLREHAENLPPKVNWIAEMPPVRAQGNRATCVPHALLAAFEHFKGLDSKYENMSVQFLYWNCKENDGDRAEPGTSLAIAAPLLERDGCCLEAAWPYVPEPVTGNEGQGDPPGGVQLGALSYKGAPLHKLPPTSVQDLKRELFHRRCVAFDIPVYNSWVYSEEVARTGELTLPVAGEKAAFGHAMCLVGYEDDASDSALGGGRFLIRNSWGTEWAKDSRYGAGYGTIPYAYIDRYGMEAYSIA